MLPGFLFLRGYASRKNNKDVHCMQAYIIVMGIE